MRGKTRFYKGTYANEPVGLRRGETTVVGAFPPNAFGLFDMHGNVWEWCEASPDDEIEWEGYVNQKPVRGGSWSSTPAACRSSLNLQMTPDSQLNYVGLRLVCDRPG